MYIYIYINIYIGYLGGVEQRGASARNNLLLDGGARGYIYL